MRSSRVRRVKRTARKSISKARSRMIRQRRQSKRRQSKRGKGTKKRSLVKELRETLSLPELDSDLGILSVQKKKKSKKKKKKSKAWSAKLHGKGTKGKKGKKSHKKKHKKHKKKKMKGGSLVSPEDVDGEATETRQRYKKRGVVFGAEKQWEQLSPGEQGAVIGLGYNQQSWDSRYNPDSPKDIMYKSWDNLTPEQRKHARTLGMDITWFWKHVLSGADAATEKARGSDPAVGAQKEWGGLSSAEKEAVIGLGYNQQSWDNETPDDQRDDIMYTHTWDDLTPEQQGHAGTLGMTRGQWDPDSEDDSEDDSGDDPEMELFSKEVMEGFSRKPPPRPMKGGADPAKQQERAKLEAELERLGGERKKAVQDAQPAGKKVKGGSVTAPPRPDPNLRGIDKYPEDLTEEERAAASALGLLKPGNSLKSWSEMNAVEKGHAETLGVTEKDF